MSTRGWREFDEQLVRKVREHPCLYNKHRSKESKSQGLKQNAWKTVSEELGCDVNKCQRRWRLLRDTYVRYKKAQESPGCKNFVKKEDNPIMDSLHFLDTFVKHRELVKMECLEETNSPADLDEGFGQENPTTVLNGDSDNDNISSASHSTPYSALAETKFQVPSNDEYFTRVRKREDSFMSDRSILPDRMFLSALINGDHQRNDDELECFVKSVSGTLHRFTPKQQAIAKVKIQQLLLDIEFGEENSLSIIEPQVRITRNT